MRTSSQMIWRVLLLGLAAAHAVERRVSVSGQSAGGSMAIQHLVAFSSSVDAAAIAGGSPYGCGSVRFRFSLCYTGGIDLQEVIAYVQERVEQGVIDDPSNLKNVPVILFSGKNDFLVLLEVMRETATQLSAFVPDKNLFRVFNTSAGHVWSVDHGECGCPSCSLGGANKCCDVNNCQYDLSGDVLRKAYGTLRPRVRAAGRLHWVDQHHYIPKAANSSVTARSGPTGHASLLFEDFAHSQLQPSPSPLPSPSPSPLPSPAERGTTLLRYGMVYVSTGCKGREASCRVHINYHGCMGEDWEERERWVRNLDLNEYAEANDLIVVYPQAAGDTHIGQGCWNWASYIDDPFFDTRRGIQLGVCARHSRRPGTVHALVQDLPNALLRSRLSPPGPDELDGTSIELA